MSINNKRSYTEYTVTQPTTDFAIGFDDFDEGSKDNILVTLNGVLVESLGYAAIRKNESTVSITPAITEGTVRLTRETDIDEPFHKFTAGALFSAKSMDENFQQVRHSQQEVRDGFVFLEYNTNGIVQASKEATAQAKAATVVATASAVRAESAADTAVQAVGSLQGVVDAATTATTNANTATATVNTAVSQATAATTTAQNAAQAANTAKQEATTAAANANAATVDTLAATGRANEAADVVADLVVGRVRAQDVSTSDGSTQEALNNKTVFLSMCVASETAVKDFFSNSSLNRVVDVPVLTVSDTLVVHGILECNNLTVEASKDYATTKSPMLVMEQGSSVSNLILDGGDFNVRGIDVTKGHCTLVNVTLKNTKYLGINGLGADIKDNIYINGLYLYNVCSLGVPADLGYGGLALEFANGASISNVKMDSIGAKGFRLRSCSNCTGDNHSYNDIQNDQGGVYFASGNNNHFTNVQVSGTRNPVKFSRGEVGSSIRGLTIDNSHIVDAVYSVCILLQGTSGCEITNFNISKGNGFGIRVEPHPADSDPLSEQPSYSNIFEGGNITSVGGGDILYSVANVNALPMSGNTFRNLVIDGNLSVGTGITLLRSQDTLVDNVLVKDVVGTVLNLGLSSGTFNNVKIRSAIGSTSRQVSITSECNLTFNSPEFTGQTSGDRYISQDCTGTITFKNISKMNVSATDTGWYIAGAHNFSVLNSSVNTGLKIGNNLLSGVIANVTTSVPVLDYSNVVRYANYNTSTSMQTKPTTITLPSGNIPPNSGVTSTHTVTGAYVGQILKYAPTSTPSNFADYSIDVFVSAPNTITAYRHNRTLNSITVANLTLNVV